MAELTNAMKGVIQSSTARTSSTYASTDLIQLYDSNNEPTIKISKDDLMAAVKASLPSLLSDQGTSGTAFPSIASGVLGSMTAANLALVLGGLIISKTATDGSDANDFETGTGYRLGGGLNIAHKPSNPNRMVIYTYADDSVPMYSRFQIACIADGSIAAREYDSNGWGDWSMTPSYLNAYSNLSSLASALDGQGAYKTLSAGQDLNDLMSDVGGKYISHGGFITETLLNRPEGLIEAFAMWVIPPSTQIIITQWAALKMYKRTKDGATFGKWQLVQGTEVNYA